MPRHKFSREECRRGGKTRSQQPSFIDACRKGFEKAQELHPTSFWYVRQKIRNHNRRRAVRSLVAGFGRPMSARKPSNAGQGYF
jgi:hypothetical protein